MIDTAYYLAIFFIFIRLISFLGIITAFFPRSTPKSFKVFFTIIFSLILVNIIDYSSIKEINSNFTIVMYIINEFMTGVILGFVTNLCFYIFQMAGSLMDMQIGLSMLTMYDPNSQNNTTLLSRIIHWIGILIFFIVDGHHLLIKELVASYNVVNIGKSIVYGDTMMLVINSFIQYFIIGLKIAIPIVLIIIITDLTLGLVSRTVPQLNIMILGLPLKIFVGIMAFLVGLPIIIKGLVISFGHIWDTFHGIFGALPLALIFSSDEKTEEATPKKKAESRKKGQVPRSKDVNIAITMVTCTLVVIGLNSFIASNLKENIITFFSMNFKEDLGANTVGVIILNLAWRIAKTYLPVVLPIMVMGVVASIMQTGFLVTGEPLKPSLDKLNPLNGFKNMFSKRSFIELTKNCIVIVIVSYVGYLFVKENFLHIMQIGNTYVPSILDEINELVIKIFIKVSLVLVILAVIDYFVQRRLYDKDMKMSKEEIKEEFKQMEGDPQVKSKIKQKQREMATRRMMQSIPDATVVVTNPTHLAIALKYEEGKTEAPIVVAKGADNLALKIKELAKENDVPIVENKPLARLIFKSVEVEEEIPGDMYQAVAEILAVVYKMKKDKK